ncbi:MAG: FG-GAP-like repeat-containing protein [Bacillota bacterium]
MGKKLIRKVLAFLLVAGSLLSGGCAQFPTPGELIKPPAIKAAAAPGKAVFDAEELKQIAQQFLPAGAVFLTSAPAQPPEKTTPDAGSRELIQAADLNSDGRPEIIAGYRVSQGSVGVMVLQKKEQWTKVWQEEGKGYNLERLQLADVTGDGQDELLIGWTIGASAGNGLDILAWQGDGLKQIARTGYHRLEVADLAGEYGRDGRQELAAWVKDTGDAFSVEVLRWDGQKLAPAQDVEAAYFPRVVEYYQQKVKETPQVRVYCYYLADALARAKDYQGALAAVEKGMALNKNAYPNDDHFQLVKGRAYLGLRRYQDALAVYQELIGAIERGKDAIPEKPTRFPSRGFVSRGEQAAGVRGYLARLLAEAFWGAGEAYLGLGKPDLARASFERARDYRPDWDKPQKALLRLPLQQVAEEIYGYWANTGSEEFGAKLRNFGDWVKKQALPGGMKLALLYTPVEGNYPHEIAHILLVDWAAAEGPASGIQAHGIYWVENGQLKSQVFYSTDAFNHGLDVSRAAHQARMALKVGEDGREHPELGVVYDAAYGGSGSPQPVFYLWRLKDGRWQVVWRSDESRRWRNSHGELKFSGPGTEEFTLVSDSWLAADGKEKIFQESNPGPHRRFLDTWQRQGDRYELKEARTLPSAYNTLVELVYNLSIGREQEAAGLVAGAGVLEQARKYGLVQNPVGQGWVLDLNDPRAEQTGPLTLKSGPAAGVTVEFIQQDGQWLVSKIYKN